MKIRIKIILMLSTLLIIGCAGPLELSAEDKLECVLPNEGKFVLINSYHYSPLSQFVRHAAERTNQLGFKAFYKPKASSILFDRSLSTPDFRPYMLESELERKKACAYYSDRHGYVRAGSRVVVIENMRPLLRNEPYYPVINNFPALGGVYGWKLTGEEHEKLKLASKEDDAINDKRRNHDPCCINTTRNASYHQALQLILDQRAMQYGLESNTRIGRSIWVGVANDTVWQEAAFETVTEKCKVSYSCLISAVWQVYSTDYGKTWSKPTITKEAKLFVINKSILDQPTVAKPSKWEKGPGRY